MLPAIAGPRGAFFTTIFVPLLGAVGRGRDWIAAAAAALTSGYAYYFVRGAQPMWPLAWLAPLPVLAFAFAAPAWIAAATAFAAYALGGSAIWQLAAGVVPAPLVAAFVLISAAAFMIMVLLTRHAVRRLGHWVAVFTYPILFTAWEYLNSIAGTSASIANSQIDFPPAVQIAALIGSWGVHFSSRWCPRRSPLRGSCDCNANRRRGHWLSRSRSALRHWHGVPCA